MTLKEFNIAINKLKEEYEKKESPWRFEDLELEFFDHYCFFGIDRIGICKEDCGRIDKDFIFLEKR